MWIWQKSQHLQRLTRIRINPAETLIELKKSQKVKSKHMTCLSRAFYHVVYILCLINSWATDNSKQWPRDGTVTPKHSDTRHQSSNSSRRHSDTNGTVTTGIKHQSSIIKQFETAQLHQRNSNTRHQAWIIKKFETAQWHQSTVTPGINHQSSNSSRWHSDTNGTVTTGIKHQSSNSSRRQSDTNSRVTPGINHQSSNSSRRHSDTNRTVTPQWPRDGTVTPTAQ